MTTPVVSVKPDTSVRAAAQMMLEHNVGALPVLDASGAPVGMVSDGDLLGRRPENKRRDWWLALLAQGAVWPHLSQRALDRTVRDVMSAPVIAASPETSAAVLAETMQLQHIKRLPIVEKGRIVGLVSRADLLGIVEQLPKGESAASPGERVVEFLESLIGGASLRGAGARHDRPPASPPPAAPEVTAAAMRARMRAFRAEIKDQRQSEAIAERRDRERQVKTLLEKHLSAEMWRSLIEHAEIAAEHGESEISMLRFPSDLCSDGGRKIDVAEPGWEATLRGEAAEMYARWRDELRPRGFRLAARVVSYARGGVIGDIGLFLVWGDQL